MCFPLLCAHGMNAFIVVIYTLNPTSSCFIAFKLFFQSRVQIDLKSKDLIVYMYFFYIFISVSFMFSIHVYFLK